MNRSPEWWLEFYEQHKAIIDVAERDVSVATSPIRCRLDVGPDIYHYGETENRIISRLFCQGLIQLCTANQKKVLDYVLDGYKICEIAEDMERDQRNISQTLRRIRMRFIEKGILPEFLRGR